MTRGDPDGTVVLDPDDPVGLFDNRDTWDNVGDPWDNRSTWDNWKN